MDNYKITQYSVNSILGFVESSQIAIPEIQRPFVWKEKEVRDLIDSLYEGYPIGYLIVWQNSKVRLRGFGKGGTKKILIDGQQRVTALMAALMGKEVLDDQYRSHRIIISFNPLAEDGENRFAVYDDSIAKDPRWIPDISVLYRKGFSYRKFEKEYMDRNPDLNFDGLETAIDTMRDIVKHQVGVIELSFLLDIDVVSEIFIRINLQGKPLNQEDFAMSKISVNEKYDGDYIRNTIDYFCHLQKEPSFFEVINKNDREFMSSEYGQEISWCAKPGQGLYVPSYADVLKVVNIAYFGKSRIGDLVGLLSGKTPGTREVSQKVAKESFGLLGEGVKAFVRESNFNGFQEALRKAGYCCDRLIYSQSVINYCYAMYLLMDRQGIADAKKQSLIGRWMSMALMTGHYQGSPDSVLLRDYENIRREGFAAYLSQIEDLRLTADFYDAILPDRFASTTVRTAPFLTYIASLCASGAKSLYSGDETVAELFAAKAESYQILPKKYLEKCGFKTRETYGQVANITYISKAVKAIVKKAEPKAYKDALEENVGADVIKASLMDNHLSEDIFKLEDKDAAAFLADRRKCMAQAVKAYYEAL